MPAAGWGSATATDQCDGRPSGSVRSGGGRVEIAAIVINGPRGQEGRRSRGSGPPQLSQELAARADGGQGVSLDEVMARRARVGQRGPGEEVQVAIGGKQDGRAPVEMGL